MAWNDNLEGVALEIARTDRPLLRVMAGPGTGKSFAMKRRVARLLEEGQDPEKILVVTFTRNAAAELVKDLHCLKIKYCEKIKVKTLHAFCFGLLSKNHVLVNLGRKSRPIMTFTKAGCLQFEGGVMLTDLNPNKFGGKRGCTKRINAFEAAWARLQTDDPGWPNNNMDRDFHNVLISWLQFHESMLIGEVVSQSLRYLKNNPSDTVLSEFEHVLVDEYQDLNRAEQNLVDILYCNRRLTIVGDINQSIFQFRHANPEGIKEFSDTHSNTQDETLNECRRCPKRVVTIANELIRHNYPSCNSSILISKPDNIDGEIHIIQWNNIDKEAQGLAEFVHHLIFVRKYSPRDILILTPRRKLAYNIRDYLLEKNIEVLSSYHDELLDNKESQCAFCLLSLLVNEEDRVALRWWLGSEDVKGLAIQYKVLRDYCQKFGRSPKSVLDGVIQGNITDIHSPKLSKIISRYTILQKKLEELKHLADDIEKIINHLLPDKEHIFHKVAMSAYHIHGDDIGKFLGHIKAHITQPKEPEETNAVRIMSPHKSKGLTSKAVIVSGCIQGFIPFIDNSKPYSDESMQEQRRLFYVAITRCTDLLVLSSAIFMETKLARAMGLQIIRNNTIASQFIDELGQSAPKAITGEKWINLNYKSE